MKLKPYTIVGYKEYLVREMTSEVEHVEAMNPEQALAHFRDDFDYNEQVKVIAIFDGHLLNLPWKT